MESNDTIVVRAREFASFLHTRRTIRDFDAASVPDEVVEACVRAAGSAPSGANQQPWTFVIVRDAGVRSQIRQAAEEEERAFYEHRAPVEWKTALAPLGTDANKPFLETAPILIAIFVQSYGRLPDGKKIKHYYPVESVGIATGMLITAFHNVGIATLTHTPSPMNFLNQILGRPSNERPFLLLIGGYRSANAALPNIHRKPFNEICTIV